MKPPIELIDYIKKNDNFSLVIHVNPDGDALGAMLALGEALRTMGKVFMMFSKDGVPSYSKFLPDSDKIIQGIPAEDSTTNLILIDCNEAKRGGIAGIGFIKRLVIDHHLTEEDFGDFKWVEPKAAASGILMYHIIKALGVEITQNIATNLYTAIAVDTGTFRYQNTKSDTLSIASELVSAGANPSYIAEQLYNKWSVARFNLLIKFLNSIEIYDDIAITVLTRDMIADTGAGPHDTEDIVNFSGMLYMKMVY
ncbi:MAG: DHH family phosphoesterase [Nitrospirae bacterium]|nr:DHH family phosphoesterase [Nitrospirota bacterium]